jgi:hypothetical protein
MYTTPLTTVGLASKSLYVVIGSVHFQIGWRPARFPASIDVAAALYEL